MRITRVAHDGKTFLAREEAGRFVLLHEESEHPAADALREALANGCSLTASGQPVPAGECTVLAPLRNPSKIIGIGLNYRDHAEESGQPVPASPIMFAKFPNSLVGDGAAVRFRPADSQEVDYEVELAVVIGRQTRDCSAATALDSVLGVTVANDLSARDAQFGDVQWTRGKAFDGFLPLGPAIVTLDEVGDVQSLGLSCTVNGQVLQSGSTEKMVFGVAQLVAYVSRFMTLEPGDLILTGTPPGVGFARKPPIFLRDGDTVAVAIEGIGAVTNTISTGGGG